MSEAAGHSKVVFDGIRPLKTIKHIAQLQPKTMVIFVMAGEPLRRARYMQDQGAAAVTYDEILYSDVERTAKGIQTYANVVFNEGSIEDFENLLIDAVERFSTDSKYSKNR
jgi:hypothetical protein